MSNFTSSPAWQALLAHRDELAGTRLAQLWKDAPDRGAALTFEVIARQIDDRGGGRRVPHMGLDAPKPPILEASDDRRQVLLSLANRHDLGLDCVGAGQRVRLGGPEQAERCAVLLGEIERSPHRRFGQHRPVKWNENLVELHMSSPVAVSLLERPPLIEQRGCQRRTRIKTRCWQESPRAPMGT